MLVLPEPREGFLQEARNFAALGPEGAGVPVEGLRGYVETLEDVFETYETPPPPRVFYFFCTVYYTPREGGFTREGGFDMSPETRGGLGGRKFSANFVRAVVTEGFGRVEPPQDGQPYLKYDGSWDFARRALGNRNNTLRDRASAAVHRRNGLFSKGTEMLVMDPQIYAAFGNLRFEAADTGGGLFENQIDLYWGEDDPRGPGPDIFRPEGCPVAVRWIVPVLIF